MVNADIKQTLERNEERISRLMVRRIGTVFDNESLLEMEREEKVLSSIRLSIAEEDRDQVNPDVEILDEKGIRVGIYEPLLMLYRLGESKILNGERNTAYRAFLKKIAGLDSEESTEILKHLKNLKSRADHYSEDRYVNLAYLYGNLLVAPEFDFIYSDVFARFVLYLEMVEMDMRLSGLPIEVEFLAHEAEHELVFDAEPEEIAIFLTDCIVSALYHAGNVLRWMRKSSELARDYISSFIKPGERFSAKTLSNKLSMDEEMVKHLFIVPAESSEGFLVSTDSKGREEYVILHT